MEEKSLWLKDIKNNKIKKINKNLKVDVLIIGGGMTGLSTAYHLIGSGLSTCLVDKQKVSFGASSRTTGKLTYLQDNIYSTLKDNAKKYYKSQKEAIKTVKKIIKDNNIDCSLKKVKSYIYTEKKSEINKIKNEELSLKELNINYQICNKLPVNIPCIYGISVNDTYVFNPVKYLLSLKEIIISSGINIYENSNVTEIKKNDNLYIITVNDKTITATYVVIACHYPFFIYPIFTPIKTYIERSYISASLIDKPNDISAISLSKPIKSIRYSYDEENYFIYLTKSHNLCQNYNYKSNFNSLLEDLKKMNLKPDYIWSSHDLMTEDHLPYIGYIDNNLLIGTGYNTWGMTNGSLAGIIISGLIIKKKNKYKKLFDPKRNKKINILKYPLYISYSIKSFIQNKISKNKSWYKSNVIFTKRNGKNIAIYIDKSNKEHIVYNRCPHLLCSLIFNETEKTWDCPCHGSRYDIDGKCIFGPSKEDITYKEKEE